MIDEHSSVWGYALRPFPSTGEELIMIDAHGKIIWATEHICTLVPQLNVSNMDLSDVFHLEIEGSGGRTLSNISSIDHLSCVHRGVRFIVRDGHGGKKQSFFAHVRPFRGDGSSIFFLEMDDIHTDRPDGHSYDPGCAGELVDHHPSYGAHSSLSKLTHGIDVLRQYFHVFHSHETLAAIFDEQLRYVEATRGWITFFDLKPQTYRQETLFSAYRGTPYLTPDFFYPILQGERYSCAEDAFEGPDGNLFYIRWSAQATPLAPGVRGIMIQVVDETKDRTHQLENDRQFAMLKKAIEKTEKLAFLFSHDLKEPLRALKSYCHLMRTGGAAMPNDHMWQAIDEQFEHMKVMIDDMLTYATSIQGVYHEKYIDLNEIVKKIVKIIGFEGGVYSFFNIHVKNPLPHIFGQEGVVTQIFQNLIANAIKFRRGDHTDIEVGSYKEGLEWIIFVRDTGIGMGSQLKKRLYNQFGSGGDKNNPEGTGVGLSITKKMMEMHDGRLWVESSPHKGTTFFLAFPCLTFPSDSL